MANCYKKTVLWGITLWCFTAVFAGKGAADSLSGNSYTTFSGSTSKSSGKTTSSSSINQGTSLSFNKTLTRTIRLSGDLRTSLNKTGSKENRTFSPSLLFNLNNEYFNSNLGYQISKRTLSSGNIITTTTKNSTFSTSPAGFPSLNLSYNDSQTKGDFTGGSTNTKQSNINSGTNYNLFGVNMQYNFSRAVSEDIISGTKQVSPRHFGTIGYGKNFFNNRLNFNTNFGITRSKTISTSLSGTPQNFPDKKNVVNGLFIIDSLPELGQLSDKPSLIDDNKASGTDIDLNEEFRNIGLKLQNSEEINTVYLYVSTVEEDISTINFDWNVYSSSSVPGDTWNTVTLSSSSYNEIDNRFELVFSQSVTALFFKAVNKAFDSSALTISVTEIEAWGSVSDQPLVKSETSSDRQFVGVSIGARPLKKMSVSYNINYDKSKQLPINTENQNISQGLSLSYVFSKFVSLSSNYQNQRSQSTGSQDTGSDTYNVSVSTNPLETVNSAITLSHARSLAGGDVVSKSNSGAISAFFKLYPGVDLGMNIAANRSKNFIADSKSAGNSLSGNLTLIPRRSIRMVFTGGASMSTTETGGKKTSSRSHNLQSTVSLNPSRYINLSANYKLLPTIEQNYSLSTNLPGRLRMGLSYNISNTGAETYGISSSLTVSRKIFISSHYNLTKTNNKTGDTSTSYGITLSLRQ